MTSTRFHLLRTLAAAGTLAIAVAACGTGGASPSGANTAPPASPSASGSASPSASGSPSASASASMGAAVTVTGLEYRYEGVPANATVGTVLGFTNGGQEAHEMVTIRRNDDVTMSFQELLALPQEESLSMVTILGAPMANPGETADASITITEPGTYALVCFIPVGMTEIPESLDPNASLPAGPPHFTQGMVAEFTVAG